MEGKLAKGAKSIAKYAGIALFVLGLFMFIIPYLMDAVNMAIRDPSWWESHAGVVAYFMSDLLWYATGLLVVGLILVGVSFALKD